MGRRILKLFLFSLCGSQITLCQEFRLANRTIQVHGFVSQGFVYTNHNNWLTMNTSSGSGAMTDMGLNLSSQLTDRMRVGAQVYDRNLGALGQWHPSLDWANVDYRFVDWFGVRAGKVKTVLGLHNETQDLEFLSPFALLPQGVYPTDLRDTTIAHSGVDLYGVVPKLWRLRDISYTAYIGHRSDSIYSGYTYLLQRWGMYANGIAGLQYGADLRCNVKGILIGASRINQAITTKGTFVDLLNESSGLAPYRISTKVYWANQFYSQYVFRQLLVEAEYRRDIQKSAYAPGANVSTDLRSWYVAGVYHFTKYFQAGSYYSHHTSRYATTELLSLVVPSQTDTALPRNHAYDKVVSARIDFNRYCYLKIEGHFIDGYALGPYPNGFYPQQNPNGFKRNTNALVLRTGFHF